MHESSIKNKMLRYRALGLRARMGRELCVTYNKIGNSKIHLIRTYKIVVEPESSEGALRRDHRQSDREGEAVEYFIAMPLRQTPIEGEPIVTCALCEKGGSYLFI